MAPPKPADAGSKLDAEVVIDADHQSTGAPTTRSKVKRSYREFSSPESCLSLKMVRDLDESDQEERESDPDYASSDSGPGTSRVNTRKRAKGDAPKKAGEKRAAKYAAFRKVNRRTTNDVDKLWDKVDDRDSRIAYLEDKLRRKDGKIDKLEGTTLANSRKRIEGKAEKIGDLEGENRSLKDDIKIKKEQIRNLQQQLDEKASVIQKIQEDSLSKLEGADFQSDPDNEVVSQLSKIFRSTKAWAGSHAVATWSAVDAEARKAVDERLRDPSVPTVASSDGRIAIRQGKIAPRVVANTLLNRTLVWLTLEHPFALVAGSKSKGGDLSSATMLANIYHSIEHKFPSASGKFRCMTAYSMLPEGCDLTGVPKSETLKADTEGITKSVLQTAMNAIGLLLNMNDTTQENIETSLLKIIRTSINTGVRMHAQYPHITFDFRKMLQNQHFSTNHNYLVPHSAMQIKDDEDGYTGKTAKEAGIIGRSPDLIIEPLVRRSGDEQGKIWSYKRVIHKATVWVCNKEDLHKRDLPPETPPKAMQAPRPQKSSKALKKTSATDAVDRQASAVSEGIDHGGKRNEAREREQRTPVIKTEPSPDPKPPSKKRRTNSGVSSTDETATLTSVRTSTNSSSAPRKQNKEPGDSFIRGVFESIEADEEVQHVGATRINKGARGPSGHARTPCTKSKASDKAMCVSNDRDMDTPEDERPSGTPPLNSRR